jgi:serine/threonine protein kinase
MIGRTIGNYVIREKIGAGGMGAVYLAEHPRIGRRVAVKVLHPEQSKDPQIVTRFFNEAKAAHEIGSEHIIEILDFGELEDHTSYFIMEWLAGRSLSAALREEPRLPLDRTLHITTGICRALAAAHVHGIVHRDLKPDNIFLIQRGEDPDFVKVLDFGIAKLLRPEGQQNDLKTKTHMVLGTPAYMSPEQCRGDARFIDQRSDIYALGVILYEMATGRRPFESESMTGMLLAHVTEAPPPPRSINPALPERIEKTILRALEKRPEQRFQSVEELLGALTGTAPPRLTPYPQATSSVTGKSTIVATAGPTAQAAGSEPTALAVSATEQTAMSPPAAASAPAVSALEPTTAAPAVPATGQGSSHTTTLHSVAAEVAPAPSSAPRRGLLVAGALALAAAAAFVAVLLTRQAPAPVSAATSSATQPVAPSATPAAPVAQPAPPPLPAAVRIRIGTVPSVAELTLDGAPLNNPFSDQLARSDMRHMIIAKAPGYRPASQLVTFDRDRELTLTLEREAPRARPTAGPGRAKASSRESAPRTSPPEAKESAGATPPVYKGTKPKIITTFP